MDENNHGIETSTPKNVLGVVFAILAFIVAASLSKYLTSEGVSKVVDSYNSDKTEQKVVDYFTDAKPWKNFHSTNGNFSVIFPTYPEHEVDDLGMPELDARVTYHTYTSEVTDGTIYMIMTAAYPSTVDTSNPEVNLEGSLNGMLASSDGNKLISSDLVDYNRYRALDFVIENPNGANMKGRIMLVDKTLYQVLVAYERESYNDTDFNKFLNSFTLSKG